MHGMHLTENSNVIRVSVLVSTFSKEGSRRRWLHSLHSEVHALLEVPWKKTPKSCSKFSSESLDKNGDFDALKGPILQVTHPLTLGAYTFTSLHTEFYLLYNRVLPVCVHASSSVDLWSVLLYVLSLVPRSSTRCWFDKLGVRTPIKLESRRKRCHCHSHHATTDICSEQTGDRIVDEVLPWRSKTWRTRCVCKSHKRVRDCAKVNNGVSECF